MSDKLIRCRHRDSWVMCGGYGLWCPECGAWRPMKPSGDSNVIVPRGGWHTPFRYKGVKPVLKLYTCQTEPDALATLREVRKAVGRRWRTIVALAWADGEYSKRRLMKWETELEAMRKQRGPGWLLKVEL